MQHIIKGSDDNNFEWIDIVDPSAAELDEIAHKYNLHPAAVQDCLQPDHLPKYEQIDETSFIITRYFDPAGPRNPDNINELSRKLSIFFSNKFIITVHRVPFEQYERIKERHKDSTNLPDVLCRIIKSTLLTYEEPVIKLDSDSEFYESRLFLKRRTPDLLKSLYQIKRKVYVIRKVVNLSKEPIDKIGFPQKRTPAYQDLKDYYLKLDTQIEELYDGINSLLSFYLSLASQRTNEVMRTLTVFTAFFLPLTFIVGIYGMNFSYMPELHHEYGYPAVMGLMLALTIVIWVWFKRKGWM